mmetsp:Transcript_9939/g.15550  ORF Transcript_9939/g.15550 Transcript_9939/m.15550 type:complete len:205 (-) Transcript_9939:1753-2367(-)
MLRDWPTVSTGSSLLLLLICLLCPPLLSPALGAGHCWRRSRPSIITPFDRLLLLLPSLRPCLLAVGCGLRPPGPTNLGPISVPIVRAAGPILLVRSTSGSKFAEGLGSGRGLVRNWRGYRHPEVLHGALQHLLQPVLPLLHLDHLVGAGSGVTAPSLIAFISAFQVHRQELQGGERGLGASAGEGRKLKLRRDDEVDIVSELVH